MMSIRDLRRLHEWTQEDLAGRLGVTPNTVARWERGEVMPGRFVVRALAQVFGVRIADIDLPARKPARPALAGSGEE